MGFYVHFLLSRLQSILDEAIEEIRHLDWFKHKMIMTFSFYKLFPRIPSLPPVTQFIKIKFINQDLDLLYNISNILEITESFLQSHITPRILFLLYFVVSTKKLLETSDPDVLSSIQSSWYCADSRFK